LAFLPTALHLANNNLAITQVYRGRTYSTAAESCKPQRSGFGAGFDRQQNQPTTMLSNEPINQIHHLHWHQK